MNSSQLETTSIPNKTVCRTIIYATLTLQLLLTSSLYKYMFTNRTCSYLLDVCTKFDPLQVINSMDLGDYISSTKPRSMLVMSITVTEFTLTTVTKVGTTPSHLFYSRICSCIGLSEKRRLCKRHTATLVRYQCIFSLRYSINT